MPEEGAIEGRTEKLEIGSDRLLPVEGRDEVNLFGALIERRLGEEADIQVIEVGGRDRFPANLQAIKIEARTRSTLRSIGVVRDADDNPEGSFQSVCHHLRETGYAPPQSHGDFSHAFPSVGVFIVPNGVEHGAVETLCRRSVKGSDRARCVELYLECLSEHDALASKNRDKSFAHVYLAAMDDPVARVGEGAHKGVWNFDSPAFEDLSRFVRDLSSRSE